MSVDRHRVPGRFILTGSTNLFYAPDLVDALTGRMEIVNLYPLSQHEIEDSQSPNFLERLITGDFQTQRADRLDKNLADRVVAGGYPVALKSPTEQSRISWYRSYATALIQKDILHLAKIHSADILPKILRSVAHLTGQLFNVTDIASQFKITRNTIRDYLILLERQFLIERQLPWHSNRMKRLVK